MNTTSKYKCGDKVRVVQGVNDPDLNMKIEGWSGEINEIEPPVDNGPWLYNIFLDDETLQRQVKIIFRYVKNKI